MQRFRDFFEEYNKMFSLASDLFQKREQINNKVKKLCSKKGIFIRLVFIFFFLIKIRIIYKTFFLKPWIRYTITIQILYAGREVLNGYCVGKTQVLSEVIKDL